MGMQSFLRLEWVGWERCWGSGSELEIYSLFCFLNTKNRGLGGDRGWEWGYV